MGVQLQFWKVHLSINLIWADFFYCIVCLYPSRLLLLCRYEIDLRRFIYSHIKLSAWERLISQRVESHSVVLMVTVNICLKTFGRYEWYNSIQNWIPHSINFLELILNTNSIFWWKHVKIWVHLGSVVRKASNFWNIEYLKVYLWSEFCAHSDSLTLVAISLLYPFSLLFFSIQTFWIPQALYGHNLYNIIIFPNLWFIRQKSQFNLTNTTLNS